MDNAPNTQARTLNDRRDAERRKYRQLESTGYGGTNHGRHAYAQVLSWQPRFVVDFGCGRNDFIRELRRRGVDGLGTDFANDEADIIASMHCVPLAAGIADVVTSFDALEHLLLEDVDPVLAEMRRVGRPDCRFIFSICTRPSRITVDGENLHPTVRPIDWWLERIGRVAVITDVTRYVTGVFHA
jgi:SAM-dependent methyltransferase